MSGKHSKYYRIGTAAASCLILNACAYDSSHLQSTPQISKSQNRQPFSYTPLAIEGAEDSGQIIHIDRTQSGGFSAMWASADCQQFLFISDYSQVAEDELALQPVQRSMWYQTKNSFDNRGKLVDMTVTRQGALRALDGTRLKGAAESVFWNGNGYVMSFDDTGDLYLYPSKTPFGDIFQKTPQLFREQPSLGIGNEGLETIAKLNNGTVVSIWEKARATDSTAAMNLINPQGIHYQAKVKVTSTPKDAAVLSDGRLVILEKDWLREKGSRLRFSMLSETDLTNFEQYASIEPKTVYDKTSVEYDNFEGMAKCTRDGREFLYIVSDDNGDWPRRHFEDKNIPRQKTLLMSFSVEQLFADTKSKSK